MNASNRLVRETFAIELCAKQPAIFLEIGVEFLNVCGGQLVQLDLSQSRGYVLVNSPFIGHLSIGAEIRFLVPLIPEVQPIGQ